MDTQETEVFVLQVPKLTSSCALNSNTVPVLVLGTSPSDDLSATHGDVFIEWQLAYGRGPWTLMEQKNDKAGD